MGRLHGVCVGYLRMMSSLCSNEKGQISTKRCGPKCKESQRVKEDRWVSPEEKERRKEGFGGDAKWLSFRIGCAVPFVSSRLLPCASGRDWCASGSR